MNRHPTISHIRLLPARELAAGALVHDLPRRLGHLLARRRHVGDGAGDTNHPRAAVRPEVGDGVGDAGLVAEGGEFVDADYGVGDLGKRKLVLGGFGLSGFVGNGIEERER